MWLADVVDFSTVEADAIAPIFKLVLPDHHHHHRLSCMCDDRELPSCTHSFFLILISTNKHHHHHHVQTPCDLRPDYIILCLACLSITPSSSTPAPWMHDWINAGPVYKLEEEDLRVCVINDNCIVQTSNLQKVVQLNDPTLTPAFSQTSTSMELMNAALLWSRTT